MQDLYIGISTAAFIAIIIVLILTRRKSHRVSTLTMLGITIILLGIIFSENRWVGYPLIGTGVLLAIFDATWVKSNEAR
jgi:hypothetical protein